MVVRINLIAPRFVAHRQGTGVSTGREKIGLDKHQPISPYISGSGTRKTVVLYRNPLTMSDIPQMAEEFKRIYHDTLLVLHFIDVFHFVAERFESYSEVPTAQRKRLAMELENIGMNANRVRQLLSQILLLIAHRYPETPYNPSDILVPLITFYFANLVHQKPNDDVSSMIFTHLDGIHDVIDNLEQSWPGLSTKRKKLGGVPIISKRIEPLRVSSIEAEIETAKRIGKNLQEKGISNCRVAEYLGIVYDAGNFYLLMQDEQCLSLYDSERNRAALDIFYEVEQALSNGEHDDLDTRNALWNGKELILIDFEANPTAVSTYNIPPQPCNNLSRKA